MGGPEAGATGAGRPGWAGAHGCPRRRPVCGPFPRLGFAARGRCGPSRETRQGSRVAPWDSRRGRALDCAQGTTSAGHLARRRAGGGRDASWRMRVAAVACCEAAITPARGYTKATLRDPGMSSTTAYEYQPSANGSVDRSAASSQRRVHPQNAYRVFPRDPACAGGAPRATARALTENAACACGVRSIGRVDTTGCASGAGPTTAGAAAGRERMG
jgi:hypothetical protein